MNLTVFKALLFPHQTHSPNTKGEREGKKNEDPFAKPKVQSKSLLSLSNFLLGVVGAFL